MRFIKYLVLIFILINFNVLSHGGKTDSNGGHYNLSTGKYHCHSCSFENLDKSKKQQIYNRDNWKHWIDKDYDCQNERAETLIRHSIINVSFKTNKNCLVVSGKWLDPYTNKIFTKASEVDIDHIVPLKEAYLSGGKDWDRLKKKEFANDPYNLLPVYKSENRKKGAKDIANYLPLNKDYHCKYVNRWISIKDKYDLTIDNKEKEVIIEVLNGC